MNKIIRVFLFLSIISAVTLNLNAQGRFGSGITSGSISGTVIDSVSKSPIEYANIVILSIKDTSIITGTVTDKRGKFLIQKVPFGKYFLDIRFIGFIDQRQTITLTPQYKNIDIGTVRLTPGTINLDNVVVEGTRNPITYQIDKKVIDVDKIQTVVSGNAADVLQNVPSVTVDIDGNVNLRGSTSFTVLIDGRPSVMDARMLYNKLLQVQFKILKSLQIHLQNIILKVLQE